MNFAEALIACFAGHCIRNEAWNGKNMYVFMVEEKEIPYKGEENKSQKFLPFLEMFNANEELVPWTPSNMDLFSIKWEVIT
jgi:hypothetical protein